MPKRVLLLLSLSLLLIQLPAPAQDFPAKSMSEQIKQFNSNLDGPVLKPEQIRDRAEKSTALIAVGNGLGTGWFVAPHMIVTNHHVIQDGIKGYVEITGPYKGGTRCIVSRILADDPVHDLAILELKYASLEDSFALTDKRLQSSPTLGKGKLVDDIPALPLANDMPHESSTVYEYGNPKGYKGSWSAGVVSAFRDSKELGLKFFIEDFAKKQTGQDASVPIDSTKGGDVMQYTTPSSHGSSGSAILNDRGCVVAVCFAGDDNGHDLNFAIPVQHVRNLLIKAKDPNNPLNRFLK